MIQMSEKVGQFVVIMGNPYSGGRDNRSQVQQLVSALHDLQIATQVIWDIKERATCLADMQWRQRCRCLVIAGGDGTVAGVVTLCRDLPVAILPLGNENLLAKELGFTCHASAMACAIAHGQTRRIDLGQVNGRPFTIMVSCGLDADVVQRVTQWRKTLKGQRRVTHYSYLKPALQSIWSYDFSKFTLKTDDQQVQGYQLLVFNMNRYARGLNFVPDAKVDDGLLHWLVWQKPGRLNLLRLLWLVKQGRHVNHKHVVMGKAKCVTVTASDDAVVQVDGDLLGETLVNLSCEGGALEVIDLSTASLGVPLV